MKFAIHTWCFLLVVGTIYGLELPTVTAPAVSELVPMDVDQLLSGKDEKLKLWQQIFSYDLKNARIAMSTVVKADHMFGPDATGCTDMANKNGTMHMSPSPICGSKPSYDTFAMTGKKQPPMKWTGCILTKPGYKLDDKVYPAGFLCSANNTNTCTRTFFPIDVRKEHNSNVDEFIGYMSKLVNSGSSLHNMSAKFVTNYFDFKCNVYCTHQIDDPKHPDKECHVIMCMSGPLFWVDQEQMKVMQSLKDDKGNVPERNIEEVQQRPKGVKLKCYKNQIPINWLYGNLLKKTVPSGSFITM